MQQHTRRGRAVVAAGHPVSAEAGADVLREGGNAVDAALAAVLASFTAEPLLTGLGAGGYLLVAGAGREPAVLDFFVAAPGKGADPADRAPLVEVEVDFGDAVQIFNVGAASVGVPGVPAGLAYAAERWGSAPLAALAKPAARLAREGVALNEAQAFVAHILSPIFDTTPECAALWKPGGRTLAEGDLFRDDDLAATIERFGRDGAAPFYEGDLATLAVDTVVSRGGLLTAHDLAAYEAVPRTPAQVTFRGRDVLTNPPPSAGGVLLAYALHRLDRAPAPPALHDVVAAMQAAQAGRTPEFTAGLDDPGFLERFLGSRVGSTTHVSVLDGDGLAASITCTNGEGAGVVVPSTGVQLNNVMGEEDLNPLGFHRDPPGRHMSSMMAPTVVMRDGEVELVLGSAGSNRIRSALLQTIVAFLDHGLEAQEAIEAPRVHTEAGTLWAEPGVPTRDLEALGLPVTAFRARNVFFGGVQAVHRDLRTGEVRGAGDPRRGGVAISV